MQFVQFGSSHTVSRTAPPVAAFLHYSLLHLAYTVYYNITTKNNPISFSAIACTSEHYGIHPEKQSYSELPLSRCFP